MKPNDWPHWLGGTRQEWRKQKRQELRAVLKAMDAFNLGCAFVPNYPRVKDIQDKLKLVRLSMRTKEWR